VVAALLQAASNMVPAKNSMIVLVMMLFILNIKSFFNKRIVKERYKIIPIDFTNQGEPVNVFLYLPE
jgi:hypothetical protein